MKVCEGKVTSNFGWRTHPVTGKKSFHNGVDIGCPIGTPVYAPCNGIVMQIYTHQTGGKTIILRDYYTGERYGFCHLSEFKVRQGEAVVQGSLLALSGNTGLGTGAHLHFSYAHGGNWIQNICYKFQYEDPTSRIEFQDIKLRETI